MLEIRDERGCAVLVICEIKRIELITEHNCRLSFSVVAPIYNIKLVLEAENEDFIRMARCIESLVDNKKLRYSKILYNSMIDRRMEIESFPKKESNLFDIHIRLMDEHYTNLNPIMCVSNRIELIKLRNEILKESSLNSCV